MLETIGMVVGGGILAATFKIAYEMGTIRKGLNGLCRMVYDHEDRLRNMEQK